MEHFELERKNCRLHYWLAGQAGKRTIVFTHGVMMDHHLFSRQVAHFSKDYQVLVWDVRGHGKSRPYNHKYSIRMAAEDLLAILKDAKANKPVLVGHSMGGYISQEAIFLDPNCASAIVTIGSSSITIKQSTLIRLAQVILPPFFRIAPDRLFRWLTPYSSGLSKETRKIAHAVSQKITRGDRYRFWCALMQSYHYEKDYHVGKPFLLTVGDQDHLAFGTIRKLAPAWAAHESHAKYVIVPNAGHSAHQDNPEFFNRELRSFLASLSDG